MQNELANPYFYLFHLELNKENTLAPTLKQAIIPHTYLHLLSSTKQTPRLFRFLYYYFLV